MTKQHNASPLVAAAAAVEEEVQGYAELAREAKRVRLDGEKGLARASRILQEATGRQARIQDKVKALVSEIEGARKLQETSVAELAAVAGDLETRAVAFEQMMKRFTVIGEAAGAVNKLTAQISARKQEGAPAAEMVEAMHGIDEHMEKVASEAERLAEDAAKDGWPDIAKQADSVRQQVRAAMNKLSLAQKSMMAQS